MSVQIKLYNLPQTGWDLIGLSDLLSTQEDATNDLSYDETGRTNEPNTYEITITVRLPALQSLRGFVQNILYTLGVPSSRDDTTTITHLSENDNNNEQPLLADKPHFAIDNKNNNDCDESTTDNNSDKESDKENDTNNHIEKSNKDDVISTPQSPSPAEPAFVTECREFIEAGLIELCEEGVGGTYFIKDLSGSVVAVFKPNDEEPGAASNPKDLVQQPLLPPGGGYIREMAAYHLDTQHFAGVPETFLLSDVSHEKFATTGAKTGSLQRYVKNEGASTDMGSNAFDVEAVHRIGLLDLRIFNLDRNGENLLVVNNSSNNNNRIKGLVPIDHTYSLPPITSLDSAYFEWHFWSQAKKPFSKETLAYLRNIDIDEDAKVLRALGLPESSIMTMIVMSLLLKEVAGEEDDADVEKKRWTLFDVANFVTRLPPSKPSKLEELVASARSLAMDEESSGGSECSKGVDVNAFLVVLSMKLREIFSQPPTK